MRDDYFDHSEEDELYDLKQEFAPCYLCGGDGVLYEKHGMPGDSAESFSCECVDG